MSSRFRMWQTPQGSQDWLSFREPSHKVDGVRVIPSSIVASIIGCGYTSIAYELKRYMDTVEPRKVEGYWIEWGKNYEQEAIDVYHHFTQSYGIQPGSLRHKTVPWLWASCDQIMYHGGNHLAILEIKCPQNLPRDWATDQTIWDKIRKHIVQVQMQMAVTEIYEAYLYYYHPTEGCLELKIPFDHDLRLMDALRPKILQGMCYSFK
ncbi:hypothetical protein PROFUN_05386 [Planoprotostelium fungivorum]|uniref:YqaJ viral recombinase domain-containing protein n=1 Tax=Planoprotostelium fungivorum TaxID=1890364 RepID=A0A2P6NQL5_9EUKA|nr:hypothetical protein PROFUN_05386 [Planoprotostelium fungivorum]